MSKIYYSISEVAEMLSVNKSLLRFWEKEFDSLIKPHKNVKGTRFYKEEDIEVIKLIYFLVKEQGLTLAGAKKKIKENKSSAVKNQELFSRLSSVKENLLTLRNLLSKPTDEDADDEVENDENDSEKPQSEE